jgi:hypothetical protein
MFITVDSKPEAVGFYEKYGFSYLQEEADGEGDHKTFPMVLCLSTLSVAKTNTKTARGKMRRLLTYVSIGLRKTRSACSRLARSA